jgi:predicted amidohydrolase YtcJ
LALPKNPIRLRHQTMHASWLNSRAIRLFGDNVHRCDGAQRAD